MTQALSEFSTTLHGMEGLPPHFGREIDQVCNGYYHRRDEAEGALEDLRGRIIAAVPMHDQEQIQAVFNSVFPQIPVLGMGGLSPHVRTCISDMLPLRSRLPLVRGHRSKYAEMCYDQLVTLSKDSQNVNLFRSFGIDFPAGAEAFHLNREFHFNAGSMVKDIYSIAEATRGGLCAADQEIVGGDITFERAVEIFRLASDVSLIRLFENGANGALPLLGDRENRAAALRAWLREGEGANLTHIDGQHKKLLCFPEELFCCQSLQELSLSGNTIRGLPNGISGLQALQKLDVSANELKSLPDEITDIESLRSLNASDNPLKKVPDLEFLRSLQEVDLSSTPLKTLDWSFLSLESLTSVFVGGNDKLKVPHPSDIDSWVLQRIEGRELTVTVIDSSNQPWSLANMTTLSWMVADPQNDDDEDEMSSCSDSSSCGSERSFVGETSSDSDEEAGAVYVREMAPPSDDESDFGDNFELTEERLARLVKDLL